MSADSSIGTGGFWFSAVLSLVSSLFSSWCSTEPVEGSHCVCVCGVCRNQSQLSAVEQQMGDTTLEPPPEEDESEDGYEDEDEDWGWPSTGAHLSKRLHGQVGLHSQVGLVRLQPAHTRSLFVQSNRQDVSRKTLVSHLPNKALSRYEHKINLGNQ